MAGSGRLVRSFLQLRGRPRLRSARRAGGADPPRQPGLQLRRAHPDVLRTLFERLAAIYLPQAQRPYLIVNAAIKAAGDPRALIATARAVLKGVDPQKPAHGLYPLEDLIGATYARGRQGMVTLLVFAGTAIFLAVPGV
jgi:hypothetical protein